jgi:kynurenine formamidase
MTPEGREEGRAGASSTLDPASAQAPGAIDRDESIPTYAQLQARTDAPPGSSWGTFGESDELGTLNFLSPQSVSGAATCVQRGEVFNLDYPLDAFPGGPVHGRGAPEQMVYSFGRRPDGEFGALEQPAGVLDDRLDGFYPQSSSHIDALRHVASAEHGLYEGAGSDEMVAGNPKLGIGRWAERGIVGRGVLVDVAGLRAAQGRPLDHLAAEPFGPDLIDEALAAQRVTLRRGDMLLLHTDCQRHMQHYADNDELAFRNAGLEVTRAMVAWLWDHQISLIATDNIAVEPTSQQEVPSDFGSGRSGNLHGQLIPLLGFVLGELWKLDELLADSVKTGTYDCLLVVKPLNLVGGVGSPANATAIR